MAGGQPFDRLPSECAALRLDRSGVIVDARPNAAAVLGLAAPHRIAARTLAIDPLSVDGLLRDRRARWIDSVRDDRTLATSAWSVVADDSDGFLVLLACPSGAERAFAELALDEDRVLRVNEGFRAIFGLDAGECRRGARALLDAVGVRLACGVAALEASLRTDGDGGPRIVPALAADGSLLGVRSFRTADGVRIEVDDLHAIAEIERELREHERSVWTDRVLAGLTHEINNSLMLLIGVENQLASESGVQLGTRFAELGLGVERIRRTLVDVRAPAPRGPTDAAAAVELGLIASAGELRRAGVGIEARVRTVGAMRSDAARGAQLVVHAIVALLELAAAAEAPQIEVELAPHVQGEAVFVARRRGTRPLPPLPGSTPSRPSRGLTVCRLVARSLGGAIHVEHTREGGASIRVTFPVLDG